MADTYDSKTGHTRFNQSPDGTLARIDEDDAHAEKIGAELAVMLKLRRDKEHPDRWVTTWGTKTNIGLARSVARIIGGF